MDVHGVDFVKLSYVDEIDSYQFIAPHENRMIRVLESHGVDRVDLVLLVGVSVKGIHHHDQFMCRRARPGGSMMKTL